MKHWTKEEIATLGAGHHVEHASLHDVTCEERAFDLTITDPPYDDRTQSNTRRGNETRDGISDSMPLGFNPATFERRKNWADWIGRHTRRWALVFSDHESSNEWAKHLERAGMIYVRSMPWIRTGDEEILENVHPSQSGAPQFTGDRPGAGHEIIVVAHATGLKFKWNGKGKHGVYTAPVVRGDERAHSAQKPLSLMQQLVQDFADRSDVIVDPFAGSGTTLVAAKNYGARAIGIEIDAKHVDFARRRVAAAQALTEIARRR